MHHRDKIRLYKETNDRQILNELVKEFEPIIKNTIKGYRGKDYYLDLYNSGITGIMDGIKGFNQETNSTAWGYMKLHIRGEIMNELANIMDMNEEQMKELAAEYTAEAFKYDYMLEDLMMLDEEDKIIMTLYAYGRTFTQIAEEIGSKEYTVRRRYNKILKELE